VVFFFILPTSCSVRVALGRKWPCDATITLNCRHSVFGVEYIIFTLPNILQVIVVKKKNLKKGEKKSNLVLSEQKSFHKKNLFCQTGQQQNSFELEGVDFSLDFPIQSNRCCKKKQHILCISAKRIYQLKLIMVIMAIRNFQSH